MQMFPTENFQIFYLQFLCDLGVYETCVDGSANMLYCFILQCFQSRYDASKGMESLDLTWVSKANALQRKGRAGRVAEGVCFHLFTSNQFDYQFREQPIPGKSFVFFSQTALPKPFETVSVFPMSPDKGENFHYFCCRNTKGAS